MSEQEALLNEINDSHTSNKRRLEIGERLSEIGDTRPGVGLRADSMPDITWLPVAPGGKITITDETFTISPFYIAKYPVTSAQYEAFVKAEDGYNNPEWWRGMLEKYHKPIREEQNIKSWNKPRDKVSWYQSVAFARWLNQRLNGLELPNPEGSPFVVGQNAQVRLPTEWEWQWAAQGGDQQREYPWGDWQEGYAYISEVKLKRTMAVGLYPQGAAECGALDMCGNHWEWCINDYSPIKTVEVGNREQKVVRGGSHGSHRDFGACVYRHFFAPFYMHNCFRLLISTRLEGF